MSARSYTATLHYSLELGHKVSRYHALRQFGRTTVVCVWITIAFMAWYLWYGLATACFEVLGLIIASSIIIYFWFRYEVRRRWLTALHAMGKPEATLVVDEESFTVSSRAGSSTIPWRRFTKIWKQSDFWLLIMESGYPLTLPVTGVDAKVLELIDEKIAKKRPS